MYFLDWIFTYINNGLQEGPQRRESGKRGRKPGRKSADKVDMKAKLGQFDPSLSN